MTELKLDNNQFNDLKKLINPPKSKGKRLYEWLPTITSLLVLLIGGYIQNIYFEKQLKKEVRKEVEDLYGDLAYNTLQLKEYSYDFYRIVFNRVYAENYYQENLNNPMAKFRYEAYTSEYDQIEKTKSDYKAKIESDARKLDLITGVKIKAEHYTNILNYTYQPLDDFLTNPEARIKYNNADTVKTLYTNFWYDFDYRFSQTTAIMLDNIKSDLEKEGYIYK